MEEQNRDEQRKPEADNPQAEPENEQRAAAQEAEAKAQQPDDEAHDEDPDSPAEEQAEAVEEVAPAEEGDEATVKLKQEVGEMRDKYMRLYSEFENFRRRTAKEKAEMTQKAGKEVIGEMLGVLDDFERAKKAFDNEKATMETVTDAFDILHGKMVKTLEKRGLKPMEAVGQPFDTDLHEAITQIPAPSEEMKGKVIDVIEQGYYLGDSVLRYAKVVVGS